MKRFPAYMFLFLASVLIGAPNDVARADIWGGLDSYMVRYIGGTSDVVPEGAPGWIRTESDSILRFAVASEDSLRWTLPYASITGMEYGQDVSRRIGWALALRSKIPLFFKKRKHYLTIDYKDAEGRSQSLVFELGKDIVRTLIASLEARTGQRVVPLDKEAREMIGER